MKKNSKKQIKFLVKLIKSGIKKGVVIDHSIIDTYNLEIATKK